MDAPQEVTTERLRLRVPRLDDVQEVFEYTTDPEVVRYLAFPMNTEITQAQGFLQRCVDAWNAGSAFPWAITVRGHDELMGMVEARHSSHGVDLGYVLRRSAWGKGYATEAVEAVIGWALGNDRVFRVWAYVDTENLASQRVLEKAGMVREGTLYRFAEHPNASPDPRNVFMYATWR